MYLRNLQNVFFNLQSEAKIKEELEDNVKGNKEAINNLYQHFTERLDEIKGVNAHQSDDLVNIFFKQIMTICILIWQTLPKLM